MKITFIYHSSFLIETEGCYMLFDYFKGKIPNLNKNKPIYIFSSHFHKDHYDPIVIELFRDYNDKFILSHEIKRYFRLEADNIIYVRKNSEYNIDDLNITTFKSTDAGTAFLINYKGKNIFHSGDLHLWLWEGETKEYNNNMEANYKREIEKLKNIDIDIAFIPLDPRQGKWYYKGMSYMLSELNIKYVFPMHCWEDYNVLERFIADCHNTKDNTIFKLNEGKTYEI